ncbi:armadillo repeat-containing protein 7 [Chelmon rostratus]|uniref:armadillo repeat-containing protein 7 n=1 Tax=Chelmon rostratus TaxID=109905 RepID=UPI001BE973D7|nr:armadillo repeat-containing protein 7 [Chelmon rostratus]XP_041818383.1 armadillo repeat-containing protein 7 [Chelmon rostratus]XP_041818384.1 armadillo repeat-containing protein 7 [Chelmon rostratus]
MNSVANAKLTLKMWRKGSSEGSDRFEYLQTLVTEFQDTDSEEAKEQVLANLANFAYDPKNMEHLRELQVADLFLDMLTEENENVVEFGMGGLCNMSMDPECRDIILQSSGISLVTNCLSSRREETVLSAITTLMNLTKPSSRSEITDPAILQCMLRFSLSDSPRLRNLAAVFLQDCCTEEQVARAEQQMQGQQTAVGIPLPKD